MGAAGVAGSARAMLQTLLLQSLGLGLLGLLAASVDDLDIVIENGSDDRDEVGLDHAGADVLRASHADVDYALEGQVPLPHVHHVLAPPLLENTHEALNAAIDGQDVADPRGGGGQVSEVVEAVDERERRGAVEGAAVVERSGDADRRLIDVGNAEVNFSHGDGDRAGRTIAA